jgi:hypothetical protein
MPPGPDGCSRAGVGVSHWSRWADVVECGLCPAMWPGCVRRMPGCGSRWPGGMRSRPDVIAAAEGNRWTPRPPETLPQTRTYRTLRIVKPLDLASLRKVGVGKALGL